MLVKRISKSIKGKPMKTVRLQTWELYYSSPTNTLLLLINGNTIFFLTHENILGFLEALSDTVTPVISLVQPMVTQQVNYEVEVNEDDGTDEEYAVFNWKLEDHDISRFATGPQEMFALEFEGAKDRQMLLRDLFNHDATEFLSLDY
jgi:hypothetical protein